MIKIAITGNIAAGKSQVENLLQEQGFLVIDTDKISHDLMEKDVDCIGIIKKEFTGFDILDECGKISREKLGLVIFSDNTFKKKLENIMHPRINKKVDEYFLQYKDSPYLFVSVPLLFETNIQSLFDKILIVIADDEIRLQRLIKRNNFDIKHARARIESQMPQSQKVEKSDFVIVNNGTLDDLKILVNKFIEQISKL